MQQHGESVLTIGRTTFREIFKVLKYASYVIPTYKVALGARWRNQEREGHFVYWNWRKLAVEFSKTFRKRLIFLNYDLSMVPPLWRDVCASWNAVDVRLCFGRRNSQGVSCSPQQSLHQDSPELQIPKTTLPCVLWRPFCMRPYKS